MGQDRIRQISTGVNTVILLLVFGLLYFFYRCEVTFMVYFSIPTVAVYLIGFVLIAKNQLAKYVYMVYFWLTLYMSCSTVCLGYGYGFHLYCFSMIPVIFSTEYIAYKLKHARMNSVYISIGIAVLYLICTGYTALNGPLYRPPERDAVFFWIFNALCVFGFLIYYTYFLIRSVIQSEEKLIEIAHMDQLTKLYNRHYMLSELESSPDGSRGFLAIADIDDFKKINDTYGHNAGDAVLKTVAQTMKTECSECVVGRWGGEEFLIFSDGDFAEGRAMLEAMRQKIASNAVEFDGQKIAVTVTVGMSPRQTGRSIDAWVHEADGKLYIGKKSGKNKIVI